MEIDLKVGSSLKSGPILKMTKLVNLTKEKDIVNQNICKNSIYEEEKNFFFIKNGKEDEEYNCQK